MTSKDNNDEKPAVASKDGEGEANPASEMAVALAKLQEKGADVKSSASEESKVVEESAESGTSDQAKYETSPAALATTSASTGEDSPPVYVAKHDALGRAYATGKRKNSIVRVWIKRGHGNFRVNGRELEKYFARDVLRMIVKQPFEVASCENAFDVMCTAKGGGLSGQAGALKHGISRALCHYDPHFRPSLKNAGFLTRDARIVERKKYGRPKARRSFQFSKR